MVVFHSHSKPTLLDSVNVQSYCVGSKKEGAALVFIIDLVVLIAIAATFIYFRVKPIIWTVAFAVLLLLCSVFALMSWWILVVAWVVFLATAAFVHLGQLRRNLITRAMIKVFRKQLPPMSETERAALEAGEVWWEGELFQGQPNWQKLHQYPKPSFNETEQAFFDKQVNTLAKMIDDYQIVKNGDLPKAVWEFIKKERFFGMLIPRQYGGLEFSAYMQSCVVSKLATRSVSAAVTVMVPNSLGPAELLLHYGTDEQKNYYLPRLATAEEVPCFALTSLEGGSDAGAMPDKGIVCKGMHEGKETLGIRLSFDKRYITLAPVATLVGLAFKLYDPEHLLGDQDELGITCALVPHDHPGMEIGQRHHPMYLSFMNGPIRATDMFIPIDWIIGGQAQAGNGWRMLMECLSAGRGISLPALSGAGAKFLYTQVGAYTKLRKQFGIAIGKFEGIQQELAKLGGFSYMTEACRVMTAGAVDLVGKPALASAIAKYHMTEMMRKMSDIGFDIQAGRAIQGGPRNCLLNLYMSVPIAITVEGANILTRNLIIFGQGAVRCHPFVFNEMQALMDPDLERGLKSFDKLLVGHAGYGLCNFVRAICYGLTKAAIVRSPRKGPLAYYYRQLTRMSTAMSLIAGLSMMLLGGALKRKESISARLGDVLSYLYLASATLKYYEENGKTEDDLLHVRWSLQYCLYEIQEAFYDVFRNFPNRWRGRLFRCVIFPWGRSYKRPGDRLTHQLADMMLTDNAVRKRFYEKIWHSFDAQDPAGRVENAFQALLAIEPLMRKLRQAVKEGVVPRKGELDKKLTAAQQAGVLTAEEVKQIKDCEAYRLDALAVDEFSFDLETELTPLSGSSEQEAGCRVEEIEKQ